MTTPEGNPIRQIDELGRIVIPKEIRKALHVKENSLLVLEQTETGVHLTKYRPETKLLERLSQATAEVACLDGDFDRAKEREVHKLIIQAMELIDPDIRAHS